MIRQIVDHRPGNSSLRKRVSIMRNAIPLLFLLIALNTLAQTKGIEAKQKAVICLTYDDGLISQLKNAIPQLDSFGFKGTFFINSVQGSSEIMGKGSDALLKWKLAAKAGHELANHTLFHPCPEKFEWQKEIALEQYTQEQLLDEIITAHNYLNLIEGQRSKRSFAFPCNNTVIGNKSYTTALVNTKIISAARLGGDQNNIIANSKAVDKFHIPSWHVLEGTTGAELIAFAKKAILANGAGVYQFHGIGGPLFQVSKKAHLELLQFLKDNSHQVTVLTFREYVELTYK